MRTSSNQPWKQAPVSMFFATVGGIGYLPGAPGTYAAVAVFMPIWLMTEWALSIKLSLFLFVTLCSVYWSQKAGKALQEHDSQKIVIDEVVGVWLALVLFAELSLLSALIGLFAFRLFDIVKLWPARWIDDHIHHGVGVVGDDLVAGLWAIPCVWLVQTYFF